MPYGWSGAFQTSQEYLNFKFSSLAATLFPERVVNGFDFYYKQQETVQGSLDSPHPTSFTCPGTELRNFAISQGTWMRNILKEESEIPRGKALTFEKSAASFSKMTSIFAPSVIVSL